MNNTHSIVLADGTILKNLELNGNNYIAPGIIKDSVFESNLSKVTISDGETTETYSDMILIQNTTMFSGGKQSWFVLAEKSQQEKEKEITNDALAILIDQEYRLALFELEVNVNETSL